MGKRNLFRKQRISLFFFIIFPLLLIASVIAVIVFVPSLSIKNSFNSYGDIINEEIDDELSFDTANTSETNDEFSENPENDGNSPNNPGFIPPIVQSMWMYNEEEELLYVGSDEPVELDVPDIVDEKPVQSFKMSSIPNSVQKLILPNSIVFINFEEFSSLENLEEVVIDNDEYGAFDGALYKKNDSGNLTTLLMAPAGKMGFEIPLETTTIGERAFANSNLTVLTLPEGIVRVMPYAFTGSQFKNIILPESLLVLESNALGGMQGLTKIELNSTLTTPYILPSSFLMAWFKQETDPVQLTSILTPGIYYKEGITIPSEEDGWKTLFEGGKYYISQVPKGSGTLIIPEKLYVEDELVDIYGLGAPNVNASNSLKNINGYSKVIITDNIEAIGNFVFWNCTKLSSASIPKSVISIGSSAFARCKNLDSLIFEQESGLEIIANGAFSECALTSFIITKNVREIGSSVFENCNKLLEINVEINNENYCSLDGILFNKNITKLVNYPIAKSGSFTIPSTVTSIDPCAFRGCINLKSLEIGIGITTIPSGIFQSFSGLNTITFAEGSKLRSIPARAFEGCESLKSILLPELVTTIEEYAFSGCLSLKSFIIPSLVHVIEDYAFSGCSSLTTIEISKEVWDIGKSAFYACKSLTSIIVSENNIRYSSLEGVLFNKAQSTLIYYPNSKASSYVIPNTVITINEYAFDYCVGLEEITIPSNVKNIERAAFSQCLNLETIIFEENSQLSFIGQYAFKDNKNLNSIIIPKQVESIGTYAFSGCLKLSSVIFEENSNLNKISSYTFEKCSSLVSIIIPDNVISIDSHAFRSCKGLISVTIGKKVSIMDGSNFTDCTELTNVFIDLENSVYYDLDGIVCKYYEGSIEKDGSIIVYIPPKNS